MKTLTILFTLLFASFAWSTDLVKTVTLEDGRNILAASENGLTLYTFDLDEPGQSNCHGRCLRAWPALLVEDASGIEAPYGVTTRDDGSLQLMLKDQPLYFWIGDEVEGDINGDNVQDVWHIIEVEAEKPTITKVVTLEDGRTILASAENGLTLYTFDVDEPGQSNCSGRCLRAWPAFTVEDASMVEAPYSVFTREDGTLHVMLNDQPLYFFVSDSIEGDIRGDNLQDVWHIIEVEVQTPAPLTKEVTLEDGRRILAAANGLTLYTFDVDEPGQSNCSGRCLNAWPAFTVEDASMVEAPYSIFVREDGALQVMLNDQPLYFFVSDSVEGDINGDGLQSVWHIIEL